MVQFYMARYEFAQRTASLFLFIAIVFQMLHKNFLRIRSDALINFLCGNDHIFRHTYHCKRISITQTYFVDNFWWKHYPPR